MASASGKVVQLGRGDTLSDESSNNAISRQPSIDRHTVIWDVDDEVWVAEVYIVEVSVAALLHCFRFTHIGT